MSKQIREAIDRRLAQVQADEALRQRIVQRATRDGEAAAKRMRPAAVFLAALVALLLITGAAFATGVAQSIFAALAGRCGPEDDARYAQMDQLSTKQKQAYSLAGLADAMLTLEQSYYDGAQLALAFTLEQAMTADLTFGPEHPMFERLESTRSEDGLSAMTIDLKQHLTEAEYLTFYRTLKDTGSAGAIYYQAWVGDDVFLRDGSELMPADSDVLTGGHAYRRYDLPLAAQNQKALDVSLVFHAAPTYYYEDAEGAYWASGGEVTQRVSVHVERNTEQTVVRQVPVSGPDYRGQAQVTCSPIGVSYTLLVRLPDRWIEDWCDELSGKEDRILDFQMVNGEQTIEQTLLSESLYDGNQMELAGRCAADTTGASEIRLRPVYRHSGPRPEEDIVVPLT